MDEQKDRSTPGKTRGKHPEGTGQEQHMPGLTDVRSTDEVPQPPPTESNLGGGAVSGPGYVAGREPGDGDEAADESVITSRGGSDEDEE